MAYSPAFQFYPGDYLGDKNTIPMTTEENGAYCLLMWFCWENDGLPDNLEELADLARLPLKKFEPMWAKRIKKCFVWDDKKKVFFHPRFLKEIKKQKSWKKKKSDGGKKGMANRWKQKGKSDNLVISKLDGVITNDNSSSSSSFLSLKEREEAADAAPTLPDTTFEPGRFDNPAVILFSELFGFKPGSGFASSVAGKVKNLQVWSTLLDNKRAYADKPLIERKKVCNWILDEYDKRIAEFEKDERRRPNLPTLEERFAAEAELRKIPMADPKDFIVSGVQGKGPNNSVVGKGSGQAAR